MNHLEQVTSMSSLSIEKINGHVDSGSLNPMQCLRNERRGLISTPYSTAKIEIEPEISHVQKRDDTALQDQDCGPRTLKALPTGTLPLQVLGC